MNGIEVDKGNMFLKLFPCMKCDIKSKGLDKHLNHFDTIHGEIGDLVKCCFNFCEYSAKNPKLLMKQIGDTHKNGP